MSYPQPSDIEVTPEQLWNFAWSEPMRDLAVKVGISDVGLTKLLRSHGVSSPPQGYWNKVRAGRPVPVRPKLPPRQPGESGRIRLDSRFAGIMTPAQPVPVDGPFASSAVPEDLEELRARELKATGRVGGPRDLDHPAPGLVPLIRKEERRRAKHLQSGWSWDKAVFDTPVGQRQLRLLNAILLALARRGHGGGAQERNRELIIGVTVGSTPLSLGFSVVGRHATETFAGYQSPARDLPATTPLKLSIKRSFRRDLLTSWTDDAEARLETKLTSVVAGIIVAGEASFRQGLVEQQEWAEQQRQWAEERRLKRLAALQAQRLADLQTSGELLRKAEEIRALVARVKAAVMAGEREVSVDELTEWEGWALAYADQLDPVKSGQVLSHLRVISDR